MMHFIVRRFLGQCCLLLVLAFLDRGLWAQRSDSVATPPTTSDSTSAQATVAAGGDWDRAAMRSELQRLEDIARKLDLQEEAELAARWLPPQRTDWTLLWLPHGHYRPRNPTTAQRSFARHFKTARKRYAEYLFAQAQRAIRQGDEQGGYRLLWRVLREDEHHSQTKRILGTLVDAVTARPRLRRSPRTHPQFGWPARSYDLIETPHFTLTSRATTRESMRLASLLEEYYVLWTQQFYSLWARPGILEERLDGETSDWESNLQMQVCQLRNRSDYLSMLGVAEENISVSVGYYSPEARTSFFYPSETLKETLFHELTHQFFAEAARMGGTQPIAARGGFWLVEGIALYMESLRELHAYYALGGTDSPRMQTARYRALRDQYWPDWQQFTAGTLEQWKADTGIALKYAHAAGLTHVMLDRAGMLNRVEDEDGIGIDFGQTRPAHQALLKGLVSTYQGQPNSDGILEQLGGSERAAKQNYRALITMAETDLPGLIATGQRPANLVLAGSQFSPEAWQSVAEIAPKDWLDASFSNARTEDLTWIKDIDSLKRISVEGSAVDGRFINLVSQLPQLEELDLSRLQINSTALQPLHGHPTLKTLWLTGTNVDATVIATLDSLPKLEFCDVGGTHVGNQAWRQFVSRHPRLQAASE